MVFVDYPVAVCRSPRAALLDSYGQAAPAGGALLGRRAELAPGSCPKPAALCTEDLSPILPFSPMPPQPHLKRVDLSYPIGPTAGFPCPEQALSLLPPQPTLQPLRVF